MEVWEILSQFFTPPFPQVVLLPAATLALTYTLIRIFGIKDPRIRSAFYTLTLFVPLVIYLFYFPSVWVMRPVPHTFVETTGGVILRAQEVVAVNLTGLLCLVGIGFGAVVLVSSYIFGVGIVKKFQGVVEVGAEDEPWLQHIVERAAKKVGIHPPRIGITDSLQPNAFTVGYGKEAIVIFSSGIISTLSSGELEAVASHELAHIKNGDFHLLAAASALRVVSFFNPASYLSSSMLAREREFLADDVGARSTHRGATLRRALVKIASAQIDRGFRLPDVISGLFIYSNIGSLRAAFTSHPTLDTRVTRIGRVSSVVVGEQYRAVAVAMLLLGSFTFAFYLLDPPHVMEVFRMLCSTLGLQPWGGAPHLGFESLARSGLESMRPPPIPGGGTIIIVMMPG